MADAADILLFGEGDEGSEAAAEEAGLSLNLAGPETMNENVSTQIKRKGKFEGAKGKKEKGEKKENRVVLTKIDETPAPAPSAAAAAAAPAKEEAVKKANKTMTLAERFQKYQPLERGPVVNRAAQLSGDRKILIQGYKDVSICNTLVNAALERAKIAASMLDDEHKGIVLTKLRKAEMKSRNASHAGIRQVPLKKAVAIALEAEQWVYQAQAAAAKFANKEAKACRRKLSGRHKMTKEEKDARYLHLHGVPRGTKAERTAMIKERARIKRQKIAAAKRGE